MPTLASIHATSPRTAPAPRISVSLPPARQRFFLPEMAEQKSTVESVREWVVDHKLRTVGCLWLSGITGSIAYNWSRPSMKTSVKIIHARLHAQALTLAALVGAAAVEYYDHKSRPQQAVDPYAKYHLPIKTFSTKD